MRGFLSIEEGMISYCAGGEETSPVLGFPNAICLDDDVKKT